MEFNKIHLCGSKAPSKPAFSRIRQRDFAVPCRRISGGAIVEVRIFINLGPERSSAWKCRRPCSRSPTRMRLRDFRYWHKAEVTPRHLMSANDPSRHFPGCWAKATVPGCMYGPRVQKGHYSRHSSLVDPSNGSITRRPSSERQAIAWSLDRSRPSRPCSLS
jgi:hypothetical protein